MARQCDGGAGSKAAPQRKPISASDEKRFLAAVSAGHVPNVKKYLERGCDPSAHSSRALALALLGFYKGIAELLLANGARAQDVAQEIFEKCVTRRQYLPAKNNHDWRIDFIISYFTPANLPSELLFVSLDQASVVRALLKAGANPHVEQPAQDGQPARSVLAVAVEQRRIDSALVLINAGASPPWRNHRSSLWDAKLLHSACSFPELVRGLLAAGADPNGTADQRPLEEAVIWNVSNTILMLLAAGADPELGAVERLVIAPGKWSLVPVFLRHGSRFATMSRHLRSAWHQEMPLGVLGLMLCAGVEWAQANFEFLAKKELQRGQSLEDVRALARARAWQEFPDMRPLKLL